MSVLPLPNPSDHNWIRTFTGRKFWPLQPRAEDVCLTDIAHALSNICRYTGHVRTFYSVAEHSVRVSWTCDPKDALWGLLHDASEAYLCDIARPVKRQAEMSGYRMAEAAVQLVVCEHFGLDPVEPASVKRADTILLGTELRDLMQGADWKDFEVLQTPINPWPAWAAKEAFLARFAELTA